MSSFIFKKVKIYLPNANKPLNIKDLTRVKKEITVCLQVSHQLQLGDTRMDNPAAMSADPAADPSQPSADAGFRICIDCLPDGTFEVESEALDESSAEEQGEPANPPLKSFGEALQAALKIQLRTCRQGDSRCKFGTQHRRRVATDQQTLQQDFPSVYLQVEVDDLLGCRQ